ncbi:hypothetical protein QBC39DRAFT_335102 [Podospora conica]|nr:hypothetical protein QBC39DRAFT_335102 [Schizothecium conicum]
MTVDSPFASEPSVNKLTKTLKEIKAHRSAHVLPPAPILCPGRDSSSNDEGYVLSPYASTKASVSTAPVSSIAASIPVACFNNSDEEGAREEDADGIDQHVDDYHKSTMQSICTPTFASSRTTTADKDEGGSGSLLKSAILTVSSQRLYGPVSSTSLRVVQLDQQFSSPKSVRRASHKAVLPQGGVRAAWEGKISNCEFTNQARLATRFAPQDSRRFAPQDRDQGPRIQQGTTKTTSAIPLDQAQPTSPPLEALQGKYMTKGYDEQASTVETN